VLTGPSGIVDLPSTEARAQRAPAKVVGLPFRVLSGPWLSRQTPPASSLSCRMRAVPWPWLVVPI